MRYFAIVMLPRNNKKQVFKLKSLLKKSQRDILEIKNIDDYPAYHASLHGKIEDALDICRDLNVPDLPWPESQNDLMFCEVNHVILEMLDDSHLDTPLNELTVRIYFLKSAGYPYEDLSRALDASEERIFHLLEKNSKCVLPSHLKEEVARETEHQEDLIASLEFMMKQPLEFTGPQFAKVNSSMTVKPQSPEFARLFTSNVALALQNNEGDNSNKPAKEFSYSSLLSQPIRLLP